MSKIVLRGGPHCGTEIRTRNLSDTWRMADLPTVPPLTEMITAGDTDPSFVPESRYVIYVRTGNRSVSGAHVYDWVGLNWGTWGAVAA